VRTFADASSIGSDSTPVAFSSLRVGCRASAQRPGTSFSVKASSTVFFSANLPDSGSQEQKTSGAVPAVIAASSFSAQAS
jgi:hypothetical protein